MKKKKLIWQIFPAFLVVILFAMVAVAWFVSRTIRYEYYKTVSGQLESIGNIVIAELGPAVSNLNDERVDVLCKRIGSASGSRITVVLSSGEVIGESESTLSEMDNHGSRSEVMDAFGGKIGQSRRYSQTLRQWMMYLAVPLRIDDINVAVVRVSLPLSDIDHALDAIRSKVLLGGMIIVLVAAFISILIARRISHPLEILRSGAQAFGSGELHHKLPSSHVFEINVLSDTLNKMAERLHERIRTVTRQRDEQNALLACMVEGVLAVDAKRHVIKINKSCADLFGVDPVECNNRPIEEIIRNPDLLTMIDKTFASNASVEGDVYVADHDRYLQAHGVILSEVDGRKIGALIVLNDITRLRNLERMRRDFVANVSHELKTPITSIKGFTETLIDGAVDNKTDLDRFLKIIDKQANRLHSIVDDLLMLSSIEHDADKKEIDLKEVGLDNVIESSAQSLQSIARGKDITIDITKTDCLRAAVNVQLLEQAIINLIENAIKYSEPKTSIHVRGRETGNEIEISIIDEGLGIAPKHLPRLFERFYRVDKGRSRDLGGTGLGLAIVKRIAIAHGGRVAVKSDLGKGSTFSIFLPKA